MMIKRKIKIKIPYKLTIDIENDKVIENGIEYTLHDWLWSIYNTPIYDPDDPYVSHVFEIEKE